MFCVKCGAKNPDESKFCISCGEVLTESTDDQSTAMPEPKIPIMPEIKIPEVEEAEISGDFHCYRGAR